MLATILSKLSFVTCFFLLGAVPAAAQSQADADIAHLTKRVEKLVELSNVDGMMSEAGKSFRSMILNEVTRNNKNLSVANKKVWDELNKVVDDMTNQYVEGSKLIILEAYRRNFTLSEVNKLIAFFSSPLGRTYADKTPAISRDISEGTIILQSRLIETAIQGSMRILRKLQERDKERPL